LDFFSQLPKWQQELSAILILLAVVVFVIARLPKIEIEHSAQYKTRRAINWLILGFTYAFLYMARYNLTVSKSKFENIPKFDNLPNSPALMDNNDFAYIFMIGSIVYGVAFIINGPLTDKIGGMRAIVIGAIGALIANFAMGVMTWNIVFVTGDHTWLKTRFVEGFTILYALNMYFQSFGAVAIVKCNASWFHIRERGVFGAIFGILISLGIYFAYDWGLIIVDYAGKDSYDSLPWVFFIPSIALFVLGIASWLFVKDRPSLAGLQDIETADANIGNEKQLSTFQVFKLMAGNPIIVTIAIVEFSSGFLRQAIMQWYRTYAKQTDGMLHLKSSYIYDHWGMFLCCAGILGGVFAGIISDHLFQSRRGPVASILYGILLICSIILTFTYQNPHVVGPLVLLMSMSVIGVHGMLSGTASMDFGGKKNVGLVVGIIDGFVYLGTGVMSVTYGKLLPKEQLDHLTKKIIGPATDPNEWIYWPVAMIPFALLGFILALKLWHAKPNQKSSAH
jgi:OPA family glycerol-3-phosphate transporter-like MFS transporter